LRHAGSNFALATASSPRRCRPARRLDETRDRVLEDEQLITAVYDALARRHPKSRTRGRKGTPADVVLRLLLLKHIRNWSYQVLEREVRTNLVYRDFTHVEEPRHRMPRLWTLGLALGPEEVEKIHCRVVELAKRTTS